MFWLVELHVGGQFEESFDAFISDCQEQPDSCPKSSIVEIRGGRRALLMEGPEVTAIHWFEGDLELRVLGPAANFTGSSIVALAEAV